MASTTMVGGNVKRVGKKNTVNTKIPWGHLQVEPIGVKKSALTSRGWKPTAPTVRGGRRKKGGRKKKR